MQWKTGKTFCMPKRLERPSFETKNTWFDGRSLGWIEVEMQKKPNAGGMIVAAGVRGEHVIYLIQAISPFTL